MDEDITNSILFLALVIGLSALVTGVVGLILAFTLKETNRIMADLKQMFLHIPETFRGAAKEIRQLSHHVSALHGLNPNAVQSVRERADKLAKEFEDGANEAERYIAESTANVPPPQNPPPAQPPTNDGGATGTEETAVMPGAVGQLGTAVGGQQEAN